MNRALKVDRGPPVRNAGELIEPTAFDRKTSETMPSTMRERAYQIYLDFLETAENKRHWNIFNDVPWENLDASKATAEVGDRVEIFCTIGDGWRVPELE
jgi:hypothetical protein